MTSLPSQALDQSEREIVISRVFQAPRALVFDAWTDAAKIGSWFGPRGFTTTTSRMEVRPGGLWVYVMRGPDGTAYDNWIRYQEIARPERLVYEHGGTLGTPAHFHVTVTFSELGEGRTQMTMRSRFPSAAARAAVVERYGAIEGGKQTLARLAEHLGESGEEMVRNGASYHFSRRFAAPRALVFQAWSEPHHLARWWGPDGFTNPVCRLDAHGGGMLRIDMRAPDGSVQELSGTVRECQPPQLLAFTCAVADGNGGIAFEVLHTVRFADADGDTLVSIETRFLQLNQAGVHRVSDMEEGWAQSLARLDEAVEQLRIGEIAPGLEIVSRRLLNAPRKLVWRAWTEPEHLARWWGPKGFRNTFDAFDPRPGGDWRFTMHGPNGTDYANHSVFVELTEPRRLVFDHTSPPAFRVVASLSERKGATVVTFRMRFSDAALCAQIRPIVVPSNEENFDRLEAELATMASMGSIG